MRRFFIMVMLLVTGDLAIAQSRVPRLRLMARPADAAPISGEFLIKVSEDPMVRAPGTKIAIRIDQRLVIECDSLPWGFHWNTVSVEDGPHQIELGALEVRTERFAVCDRMEIWVRNHAVGRLTRVQRQPESADPGSVENFDPAPAPRPAPKRQEPRRRVTKNSLPKLPGLEMVRDRPALADEKAGDDMPGQEWQLKESAETRATFGRHQWYLRCGVLFHEDLMAQTTDAFLPWNEQDISPSGVTANADGAAVETTRGVRHISLVKPPDSGKGYDGFIRVRLGSEADRCTTATARKMSAEIASWQGVTYLWGGESRSGVDCSGFVMNIYKAMGISLPHGTTYLRGYRESRTTVVHDELRYGDILVYPGHCAIYTGEGTTAETVGGHVGHRTIWIRDSVVVRRFLDVPSEKPWERSLLASRGGRAHRKRTASSR